MGATALSLFLSEPARAQGEPPAPATQAALPLDRLTPSWAGDRFFAAASPYASGRLAVHGGLLANYAHDPLVVRRRLGDDLEEIGSVVEHQLTMHADVTFAVLRRLAFNVSLPVALAQAGDDPSDGGTSFVSPSDPAVGDLRLGARASLTGTHDDFFQLGVGLLVWMPTASDEVGSFLGNGSVRAKPQLMASGVALRFVWGVDAGIEFRRTQEVLGVAQGSMLTLRLANGVLLGSDDQLQLSAELAGALVPVDVSASNTNLELLAGAKWRFVDDFVLGAALGPGLLGGIGTPDVRAVVSFAFSPLDHDPMMRAVGPPD